ncbi:acyl--CoA ligase [Sphingosinicellaceae bacterium]|nr:acyl--CoA ligase [Sphingosinicellaceae bacterium]
MSTSATDAVIDATWAELTATGADYEVTTVQLDGLSVRTYARAPSTMTEVWTASAAFGDRDYLVFDGERISYRQAHVAVASVAHWLRSVGVAPGDRVAIAMRNYPEWMLAYWAALSVGAVAVGMNAWWVAEELAFALDDAAPKVVFCDGERRERLTAWAARSPSARIVVVRTDVPPGSVAWSEVATANTATLAHLCLPDDDACIFYTSGTTGTPKGAQLTHRGCVNTLVSIGFATDLARISAAREAGRIPAEPTVPVALVTTPLFHVTANNSLAHPVTAVGGALILMYKWDAAEALRLIEAEHVTVMSGVPTMLRELLTHPDALTRDLSTLSTLNGGGAAVSPDLVSRVSERPTGMQPSTGFGMTETCGIVSAISGPAFARRPTSCGRPLPTFEVKVIDDAGTALPQGSIGELCVKGAGVIKGYWNRPEATDKSIVDGWLRTGDIGRIDDAGYLFIVDRKKDMVLRGGENVYCAEVEAALYRHPHIAEACVFGVPDERLGEEVGAAVVLGRDASMTEVELREHTAALIAAFKVPRHIWILSSPLPRNASGKFLRRELRDKLSAATARPSTNQPPSREGAP